MPGYGISRTRKGLLPWKWAEQRLNKPRTYWISTVRPDGRPHTMPVWAIWIDGAVWFSTGRESRKARNLAANPNVVVSVEIGKDNIVVEGIATELAEAPKQFSVAYKRKYNWNVDPTQGPFFVVAPRVVFGFTTRTGQFVKTATRWMFR
jgi:nitroimidazol reductase NimA-like FMN-containing flavoprotein (pyridoxamine 5'-phosphate oxidase superfamily)